MVKAIGKRRGQKNGADGGGMGMWEWGYLSGISPAQCVWLRMVRVACECGKGLFLDKHRDGDRSGLAGWHVA